VVDEIDAMVVAQIVDAFGARERGAQLAWYQGIVGVIGEDIPEAS
jgi:hypothetical protein